MDDKKRKIREVGEKCISISVENSRSPTNALQIKSQGATILALCEIVDALEDITKFLKHLDEEYYY